MSEELKPCPFCGWQPAAEHHSWQGHTVEIGCPNPDCPMMNVDTGLLKPEKAKAAWNTRPIEDALRAEVARLAAELAEARDTIGVAEIRQIANNLGYMHREIEIGELRAEVARELGRNAVLCDLSLPYLRDIARERLGINALAAWENGIQAGGGEYKDLPIFSQGER